MFAIYPQSQEFILYGEYSEVCEELRKKMIDVCRLQEVRYRGQGARILGVKGRRYKLSWSGKGNGVGVVVKGELCEKVVEVRRLSEIVITVVVFEELMLRLNCGYALQSGRILRYIIL